jgi:ribA/ribD-fused uncharacterized protein
LLVAKKEKQLITTTLIVTVLRRIFQTITNNDKHMATEITFTKVKLPFGWLGNMSPFPINHDGKEWRTTEALFQSLRFDKEEIKKAIREQKSPMAAKLVAKGRIGEATIELLSQQDLENMRLCLRLKVEQHPKLKQQLLDTNNATIIENVTKRGRRGSNLFWGALQNKDGTWEGQNWLGKLWMELRDELAQ